MYLKQGLKIDGYSKKFWVHDRFDIEKLVDQIQSPATLPSHVGLYH